MGVLCYVSCLVCCVVLCRAQVSEGITPLQESLQAARLHDTSLSVATIPEEAGPKQEWVDIDAAEANNPLYAAVYAEDICQYMKRREVRVGRGQTGSTLAGVNWE